jgi:FlaA1/EpsC-like NDP-sugar epimerase
MDGLMQAVCPDIVFHAAAHKHVPLMEMNPAEAVLNNVGGTRNLVLAAEKHRVERFVMVSTDKAVNPTSVMGATKRVAELIVQNVAARSGLAYVTVRFGNVLGSRGSVVPTFQKQIAAGGPVTVTHPDVKRYFMTIPEAVQLVLQASVLGKASELFMLDMGEPVKIVDLASDLIRLSGLEVGRDIDIVFTGLRDGDKLFEEMLMKNERFLPTEHEQIYMAKNGVWSHNSGLQEEVDSLLQAALSNEVSAMLAHLCKLVPEYRQPQQDKVKRELVACAA